jgi:hypothetical protein
MKKLIIAALALVGLGTVIALVAGKARSADWEDRIAKMPDSAPPKWIYRNVNEIRENTLRILETLESQPTGT